MPQKLKSFLATTTWAYRLVFSLTPRLITTILICQLFTTILPFLEQRQVSRLVDDLISYFNTHQNPWVNTFLILIIVRFFKILFFQIYRLASRLQNYQQDNELAKIYTRKVSSLDYQQLEDKNIASLMAKVSEEYRWRTRQVFGDITELLSQIIGFGTILVLLYPRFWHLGVLLMLGEIPTLITDNLWSKKSNATFERNIEKTRFAHDINWQLVDKKYIAELRINRAINWLRHKAFTAFDQFLSERIHDRFSQFLPNLIVSSISIATGILCMYFVILEIDAGRLTIGMSTFYFSIIRQTGDYFSGIFAKYNSIAEQIPHLNNFRKILDLAPTINSGHFTRKNPLRSLTIEFRHVSFKYPDSDRYIFRDFNLTIQPNEEIALVGENGAGKSTFIKLLCRFYDPTDGQIFINGRDLRDFDLDYWYSHLSLLTQEFNTYHNLSLRDNVLVGHPQNASDQRLTASLHKSEAADFIKKYPHGLDTMMSRRYGGEEPSWGQWQKIAIARSFYRDAQMMILDEPTASIDAVAESKIFTRLYREITDRTVIIVSHRFSTVRNASRIIVLDQGQIVEQGGHEQLLAQNGLYARSFNLQAQGYQA